MNHEYKLQLFETSDRVIYPGITFLFQNIDDETASDKSLNCLTATVKMHTHHNC